MPRDVRILILAQTNPCFSHKYLETVCTAGITENYEWIRLYPLRKRLLSADKKYQKWQWVTCRVDQTSQTNDCRPESCKVDQESISPENTLPTDGNWRVRRKFLLSEKLPVFTTRKQILEGAQENEFSLCLFKPTSITRFYSQSENDEFTEEEKKIIKQHCDQGFLFSFDDEIHPSNLSFKKIPYSFHCKFKDNDNIEMNLSVLDWEISSLYRNCKYKSDTHTALKKTLDKYNGFIESSDIYFVLGTRNTDHNIMRNKKGLNINPWSIISVIYLPKQSQMELDL